MVGFESGSFFGGQFFISRFVAISCPSFHRVRLVMARFLVGFVWLVTGFVFPDVFLRKLLCSKQVRHFQLASFGNGAFSRVSIFPPARRVERALPSSLITSRVIGGMASWSDHPGNVGSTTRPTQLHGCHRMSRHRFGKCAALIAPKQADRADPNHGNEAPKDGNCLAHLVIAEALAATSIKYLVVVSV